MNTYINFFHETNSIIFKVWNKFCYFHVTLASTQAKHLMTESKH